jgi:hypothetical protein
MTLKCLNESHTHKNKGHVEGGRSCRAINVMVEDRICIRTADLSH